MANDSEKEQAARASLKYVRDGQIVGLGSGSTATLAIRFLGELVREGLNIRGIPSSVQSRDLALELGIPLTTFDEYQQIDVTIDGADEFDPSLNLIKGGGGAMLRGFDLRIEKETAVRAQLVDLPLETVVLGAGRCLESFDRLKDMFM